MDRFALLSLVIAVAACGTDPTTEPDPEPVSAPEEQVSKADAAELTYNGKDDFAFDICERNGWYGDGTCDWFCPIRDTADCDVAPLGPEPSGDTTRFPIVLAHGFMAGPDLIPFFNVRDALAADGHVVFEGSVAPFDGVDVRAAELAEQIDVVLAHTGAEKVNIIAHSMGGLDSRFVISTLGMGDKVASLTTVSTPHRGSGVADIALKFVDGPVEEAINAVAGLVAKRVNGSLDSEPNMRAALEDLAESTAPDFNAANPDDPRVFYQSWAGVSNVFGIANPKDDEVCGEQWLRNEGTRDVMAGLLVAGAKFVAHGLDLTPNDGLVTVESARWGAFVGCTPADHGDEVGLFGIDEPDEFTGFHHTRFYRNVAFDLAARGF